MLILGVDSEYVFIQNALRFQGIAVILGICFLVKLKLVKLICLLIQQPR